jgi:hypothetical protein
MEAIEKFSIKCIYCNKEMKNSFMFEYKNRYICGCDKISILDIENDKIVFFDMSP